MVMQGETFTVTTMFETGGEFVVHDVSAGPLTLVSVDHATRDVVADGTEVRFQGEGGSTEALTWTFECDQPGMFTVSGLAFLHVEEPGGDPRQGNPTTLEDSGMVECVSTDGSSGAALPDDDDDDPTDPTDPTDDPTDPTDDPTDDPPTGSAAYDVYQYAEDDLYYRLEIPEGSSTPAYVDNDVTPDVTTVRTTTSPDGGFIFVSDGGSVQGIARDPATGDLTLSPTLGTYDGFLDGLVVAGDNRTLLATGNVMATQITKWGIEQDGGLGDRFAFEVGGGLHVPCTNTAADSLYVPQAEAGAGYVHHYSFFGIDAAPQLQVTVEGPLGGGACTVHESSQCLFYGSTYSVVGVPLGTGGEPGTPVESDVGSISPTVYALGETDSVLVANRGESPSLATYAVGSDCSLAAEPTSVVQMSPLSRVAAPAMRGDEGMICAWEDNGSAMFISVDGGGELDEPVTFEMDVRSLSVLVLPRE